MAEPITLARPYASAAFEYARRNKAAGWNDMLALAARIVRDEAVAGRVLDNPRVSPEAAAGFILDVGGDRFSREFGNLVRLLAENRRLALLPEIAALFAQFEAEAERTLDVEVTAAVELPKEYLERLEKALSKRFERQVRLAHRVDEHIIGGAVIRAGDSVLDGSVRGRLAKLANDIRR